MTRKKVKLAFITNDSARKATFKKRKKGLMKKVNELSTLCGIKACAIIYSPYDSQPEVWPSPLEARQVAAKFKGLPEMEQSKKKVNQESFLRQRVMKAVEQLKKQRKDNREKYITQVMFQIATGKNFHDLSMMDFNDLGFMIDQYLKDIYKRMDTLSSKVSQNSHVPDQFVIPSGDQHAAAADLSQQAEIDNSSTFDQVNLDAMQRQPWFMDLMTPPQEHMRFGGFNGDEMVLPFGDNSSNVSWSTTFFP